MRKLVSATHMHVSIRPPPFKLHGTSEHVYIEAEILIKKLKHCLALALQNIKHKAHVLNANA